MKQVKWLVAVGFLCVGSLALAGERGATRPTRVPKGAAAATEHSPYTIYDGAAVLIRSGETQWKIQLDQLDDPIVLAPVSGRSNIPLKAELDGRINLGLQGSKMVILIETDGPGGSTLYQAVLMFDRAGAATLSGLIPNQADIDFSRMDASERAMKVASLMALAEHLRLVSAMSSGLAAFGDDTVVSKLALSSKACAGGSGGCFLACDACCPVGQTAESVCRFLGRSRCGCNNNGATIH